MWWLKCHCVEPRLLAGWHGARCARITNATQTQKNPNSASATAQPPSPHPRPPPRRSHSHATGDQTKHLASRPASHCCTPPQDQGRKIPPTTGTTSRTTAPTNRGPRRWGGHPATPPASPGHPPTRKTDFLLALTFSARHAALLVVLAEPKRGPCTRGCRQPAPVGTRPATLATSSTNLISPPIPSGETWRSRWWGALRSPLPGPALRVTRLHRRKGELPGWI